MSKTMSHSRPDPEQLARWDRLPDTSLGISGVSTHGRCWHQSADCPLYRATTNRPVTVGPVEEVTAGEAKAHGYGLCSWCLKLLTSA
jgi:hypothetical protein